MQSNNLNHIEFHNLLDPLALSILRQSGWVTLKNIAPLEPLIEALLSPIGSLIPQYGQKKFWAVETKEKAQGTSLGDQELRLHTELAEFSEPPEYVALYAEQPANEGGKLRLLDSRPFIASLTEKELNEIFAAEMTIKAEGPIAIRHGEFAYTGPIFSISPHGLQLKFDQCFIDQNAPDIIKSFRDRLLKYAEINSIEIKQKKGTLLIWDNRFILHGRSSFSDSERRLWRCCIRDKQTGKY